MLWSLSISRGHSTREPASSRVTYFILRAYTGVPAGSPLRGGDVAVYGTNQPNLPIPFYSVLVCISVFMALSTVFYSINSHDNSPFSHSVLPVLCLSY